MSDCKREELNRLSHEAQYVWKNTRLDVKAFLALPSAERAETWRSWDAVTKAQCVTLVLLQRFGDWDDEAVKLWVDHYDARYALPVPPVDPVAAELERLAGQFTMYMRSNARAGDRKGVTFFIRSANACEKALRYWRAGVRPQRLPGGQWLLPSQRPLGQPHILWLDGDWQCSCAAGSHMHWSSAICMALEATGRLDVAFWEKQEVRKAA